LVQIPYDLGVICVLTSGIKHINVCGIAYDEVVVLIPVPFRMRKDFHFKTVSIFAVDLVFDFDDLHPKVDGISIYLRVEMVSCEIFCYFVGSGDRILNFIAGNVCSIHLFDVCVDDLMELQCVNFDGEPNEPIPIRVEGEVIIRVHKDTKYFFEL
jgi:hypothetical protein